MLPLSNIKITFNRSHDFLKCVVLAHIAAGVLVLLSSLHAFIIVICFMLLVISQRKAYPIATAHPHYKTLTRYPKLWLLEYHNGQQEQFETIQINFDGGFFLLLLLTHKTSKKRIILFNDQITLDQHRQLKVLSRIS